MAWRNRTSLPVLLEHFPSLKEDGEGKMVGWCPCQHPEGVPTPFIAYRMEEGLWAIDFCEFGDSPTEIWAASKQPRESGDDDDKKPGFIETYSVRFSLEKLQADLPPRRALLKSAATGRGVLKAGELFMLAAKGGAGKSNAFMQLGVAIATGTAWLGGAFGWATTAGPVLGMFAEENEEEVQRRLQTALRAAGLLSNDEEVQRVLENFILCPLRGRPVDLIAMAEHRVPIASAFALDLLADLRAANAAGRPFSTILLDPLSRFGPTAEIDNEAGTRFVQICEAFSAPDCGSVSVGITHHLRKVQMTDKGNEFSIDSVRGPTALTNGVRWVGVLAEGKDDLSQLKVRKSNYGAKVDPLTLAYVQNCEGMMVAIAPKKSAAESNGEIERDMGMENRLLNSIERRGPDSGKALSQRLGVHQRLVNPSLNVMVGDGRLVKDGWKYCLPPNKLEPVRSPDDEPKQGSML